jgi:rhodanese-related sulfurtransferase
MLTLTPQELISLIDTTPDMIEIIDVRNQDEWDTIHLDADIQLIPLPILPIHETEINTSKKVICICRSGGRSGQACTWLATKGISAYNLVGGMMALEKELPNRMILKK